MPNDPRSTKPGTRSRPPTMKPGDGKPPSKPPASASGEKSGPVATPGVASGRQPTRAGASRVPSALAAEAGRVANPGPAPRRSPTRAGVTPVPSNRAITKPPLSPIGPGSIIDGRYKLESALGSGGMSTVYRGTHVRTGGKLAIKLLDPKLSGKADMQQRCMQEARAMMEIASNHVVRAYDVGATPSGQVYIVMEHLEGEDLDRLLQRDGPQPWQRIAAMGVQICSGLSSAHAKGTYHRDIKPQNCFRVTLDRNPDHIKLIDFGIAKDTNSNQELTQDGVLLGTPEYMAPELISSNAVPDARSDVYAVGASMYKLVTGSTPFFSKNILDLLYHQKHSVPDAPSKRAPERGIPPEADAILLKALEKDPAKRFQTADEMAHALIEALDGVPAGIARHMTQPGLIKIPGERSRPGTTPIPRDPTPVGTAKPEKTPIGTVKPNDPTPIGTAPPEDEASTVASEPIVRDVTQPSRQYDTGELRPVAPRDIAARGGTLLSLALLFGVASYLAAPSAPAPEPEVAAAELAGPDAKDEPVPADTPPEARTEPVPTDTPPEARTEPVPADTPPEARTEPVPADTPPEARTEPAPADTPPEPVPADPPPEARTEPAAADAPAAAGEPDPAFNYRGAEKELRDQHKFLQKCLDDHGASGKLKFSLEVRKSGMPPHKIKVFSGNSDVRNCVRNLFEQFVFDSSPRGGAFAYTYNNGKGALEKLPLSTPPAPTK